MSFVSSAAYVQSNSLPVNNHRISLSQMFEQFISKVKTHQIGGCIITSYKEDHFEEIQLQKLTDTISSSLEAASKIWGCFNTCLSDGNNLAKEIYERTGIDANLLFIQEFVNDKKFGPDWTLNTIHALEKRCPWVLEENHCSPVGYSYHTLVHCITDGLPVALDLNYGRTSNFFKASLLVASTQEQLQTLIANCYFASVIRSDKRGSNEPTNNDLPIFYDRRKELEER